MSRLESTCVFTSIYIYVARITVVIFITMRKKARREARERTMQINPGESAVRLYGLIKRVFEHAAAGDVEENGPVTIFRHSFIPYGTKIHTTVAVQFHG